MVVAAVDDRRLVIMSAYPGRIAANKHLWTDWDWSVYVATGGPTEPWVLHNQTLRRDWHLLAVHAVEQGWDESVVVSCDDVGFNGDLPPHVGEVCVYSGIRYSGHICQATFSATPDGWKWIEWWWSPPYRGSNCALWKPDAVYDGELTFVGDDIRW